MAKPSTITVLLIIALVAAGTTSGYTGQAERQVQLDNACEQAREQRLAPERARFIEECVTKKQKPDRAACDHFYRDYGARSGQRAPLYYDLPACVEAFEFRKRK